MILESIIVKHFIFSEIPTELQKKSSGVIHVNLEDHRHEDFVRIVSKFKTFQGEGHTLGR